MLADKLMREKSLADQVKVTVSTSHWKQRSLGVDSWGSGLGSGQGCCVTLGKPLALSEPLPPVLAFQALGVGGARGSGLEQKLGENSGSWEQHEV